MSDQSQTNGCLLTVGTVCIAGGVGALYGSAWGFITAGAIALTACAVCVLAMIAERWREEMTEPDPNEANKQLAITIGALTISLIDNGTITQDEYDRAYAQATADIDQEFARKRDEKGEPQ